jgi:hypothetical protein
MKRIGGILNSRRSLYIGFLRRVLAVMAVAVVVVVIIGLVMVDLGLVLLHRE